MYLRIAIYLLIGLGFSFYTVARMTEKERTNVPINLSMAIVTLLWPIYLIYHLNASAHRGSFKRDNYPDDDNPNKK